MLQNGYKLYELKKCIVCYPFFLLDANQKKVMQMRKLIDIDVNEVSL